MAATCALVAAIAHGADGTRREALVGATQRLGSLVRRTPSATRDRRVGRGALAFRFRAKWTGSVAAVRFYVIHNVNGRTGYSGGTGGTLRVAIHNDSGGRRHVPRGRPLATAALKPEPRGFWPLVASRAGPRRGRALYHVVFTNIDSDPERNFVSVNALFSDSRWAMRQRFRMARRARRISRGGGRPMASSLRGMSTRADPRRGRRPPWPARRPRLHGGVGRDGETGRGQAMVRQLLRTPAGRATRISGVWLGCAARAARAIR